MKCDELKAVFVDANHCIVANDLGELYYKPEVDAAIAELKQKLQDQCLSCPVKMQEDDVVAELKKQVHDYAQGLYVMQARAEKEARHHKYKRCLAMAKSCEYRFMNLEKMINTDYRTKKMRLSQHWWAIWLKLADLFKEVK